MWEDGSCHSFAALVSVPSSLPRPSPFSVCITSSLSFCHVCTLLELLQPPLVSVFSVFYSSGSCTYSHRLRFPPTLVQTTPRSRHPRLSVTRYGIRTAKTLHVQQLTLHNQSPAKFSSKSSSTTCSCCLLSDSEVHLRP